MRAFWSHCFLRCVIFHLFLLDLNLYQEKFNWQNILFLRNIWYLKLGSFEIDIKNFETLKLEDFELEFGAWNLKFWDLGFWKLRLETLIMKFGVWIFFLEILKTKGLDLKIGHWERGIFLILGMKILNWKFGIWSCSWIFVHRDLSFEDLFRGFSFYEDVFMEICPLKKCSWRSVLWRFVHGDLSFFRSFF